MQCQKCKFWIRFNDGDTTIGECQKPFDKLPGGWQDLEEMAKHEPCLFKIYASGDYSKLDKLSLFTWQNFFCKHFQSKTNIIVVVSGYYAPIHEGHVECLTLAKQLGDKLIVILNNDKQLKLKKGNITIPFKTRKSILEQFKCVDAVIESIDTDLSICKTLEMLKPNIFAKGGDRNSSNIPEKEVCDNLGIKVIDGLGEKIQSSSNLINGIKNS